MTAASIEAHLLVCADRRDRIGAVGEDELLEQVWAGVVDVLDQPRPSVLERLVTAVGVPSGTARLIAATARVRWLYLVAVVATFLVALVAASTDQSRSFEIFLLLAPLGPLVATATAFSPRTDPLYELTATAPVSALRILLLRTVAATVPAMLLTSLSTLWLLDRGWMALGWLLPSLALALATLALSSWMPVELAAVLVGSAWFAAPLLWGRSVSDALSILGGPIQIGSLVVTAMAATVMAVRLATFEYREV